MYESLSNTPYALVAFTVAKETGLSLSLTEESKDELEGHYKVAKNMINERGTQSYLFSDVERSLLQELAAGNNSNIRQMLEKR